MGITNMTLMGITLVHSFLTVVHREDRKSRLLPIHGILQGTFGNGKRL